MSKEIPTIKTGASENAPDLSIEQLKLLLERVKESNTVKPVAIAKSILAGDTTGKMFLPANNGNTIPVESYKAIYDGSNMDTLRWMVIFDRYFSNSFKIKDAEPQVAEMWRHYLSTIFWYGSGAIHFDKETKKYIAYGITSLEIDENLQIEKAKVWINNLSFMGKAKNMITHDAPDGTVYGKMNHHALPQIILLFQLIKDINKMLISFRTNMAFNTKKINYKQRNNSSAIIQDEISNALDPNVPFLITTETTDVGGNSNAWTELNLPDGKNIDILGDIKGYIGFIQTYLGIYGGHNNFKKERNISDEFTGEQLMTQLQLDEMKNELNAVLERANKEFGTNWQLNDKIEEMQKQEAEIDAASTGANVEKKDGKNAI